MPLPYPASPCLCNALLCLTLPRPYVTLPNTIFASQYFTVRHIAFAEHNPAIPWRCLTLLRHTFALHSATPLCPCAAHHCHSFATLFHASPGPCFALLCPCLTMLCTALPMHSNSPQYLCGSTPGHARIALLGDALPFQCPLLLCCALRHITTATPLLALPLLGSAPPRLSA